MHVITIIAILLYIVLISSGEDKDCDNYSNGCKPLLLTPFIKKGKIKEARTEAEVKFGDFKNVKSYSGYFTVNEKFNSNLFFWFFPSETDYEESPVILWLQGGPGTTCMIGVFMEHGPFIIQPNLEVALRYSRWSKNHSVIYIDSPVGTGYSFTDPGTFAQNQTIVGDHLYSALVQFFQVFPEIQTNPFFVIGESYAGKYVPSIAHTITVRNPTAKHKINLQGFGIGNGFSDPEHQMKYSEYLFQTGLIDLNGKKEMEETEQKIVELIHEKRWEEAYSTFSDFIYDGNGTMTFFEDISGFNNTVNILDETHIYNIELFTYITDDDVMAALHVPHTHVFQGNVVAQNLIPDFMQSVAPWVAEMLSLYRVLVYNGQLDIIVTYAGTVNYLHNLKFDSADIYKTAKRNKWTVGGRLAGYVKCAGNLTEVLVRNAGHMVPLYQPVRTLDLVTKFIRNQSLY